MAFLQQLQDFEQATSVSSSERSFDPQQFQFETALQREQARFNQPAQLQLPAQFGQEELQQLQQLRDDPQFQQLTFEQRQEIQAMGQQLVEQADPRVAQQLGQQFGQIFDAPPQIEDVAFEQEQQLQEPFGVPQQRVRGQLAPPSLAEQRAEADQLDLLFGVPQGQIGNIEDIIGDFVVHQDAFIPEFTEFNPDLRRLEQEFLTTQQSGLLADDKRRALDVILANIRDLQQRQFEQTEDILTEQEQRLDLTVVPEFEEEAQDEPLFEEAPEEEPAFFQAEEEEFEFQPTQRSFEIANARDALEEQAQIVRDRNDVNRRTDLRPLIQQIDQIGDELQQIEDAQRFQFQQQQEAQAEEEVEQKAEPPEADPNIALRLRLIAQIRAIEQRAITMTEKQRQIGPLIQRIESIDENLIADARIDHPFAIDAQLTAPQVVPAVAHVGLDDEALDIQLEQHLQQISQRIGQEQLTIQGITRFAGVNNIAQFQTSGFNGAIVADTIERNLDGEDIRDRFQLTKDLREVFEIGLKGALASDMPSVNLLGVISEIGRSLGRLTIEGQDEQQAIKDATDQALFALVGQPFLESFSFSPLRLPRILGTAFSPDVDRLMEANLPIAEIQQIARVFDAELPNALDGGFGEETDTTNNLRQIRIYIEETVANPLLRDTIISNIDVRIAKNLRETNEHIQTDPFLILPQSVTRSIRIRENAKKDIGDLLQLQINRLDTDLEPGEEIGANVAEINAFIRQFNQYTNEHHIRVPIDTVIPGEDEGLEPEFQGATDKEFNVPEITDEDEVSGQILRDLLVTIRNMFSTGNIEFTFNPQMSEGPDGLLTDNLIKDLRMMFMDGMKSRARELLTTKDTTIGQITVGKLRDKRRVITIPQNVTINNIMTLAYTLLKEAGVLSDTTGVLSIMITKKTDVRMVISLITNVMMRNMGKQFQLIYIPMNPVGGMFLDSALKNIRDGKMYRGGLLLKPSGIGKPDMLQAIGGMPLVMFTRFI